MCSTRLYSYLRVKFVTCRQTYAYGDAHAFRCNSDECMSEVLHYTSNTKHVAIKKLLRNVRDVSRHAESPTLEMTVQQQGENIPQ